MSVNENLNYLLPTKATLDVIGAENFSLTVQNFKIPKVFGYIVEQPTPNLSVPLPGNKLVYSTLEVSIIVTENLKSWKEIHDWMTEIYAPVSREQFKNKRLYLQPAILTVYTSANNPYARIKFIDMFPIKMDEIIFDVEQPTGDPMKTKIEFAFNRYEIEII